jgi:rubrerythrin
MERVPAMAQNMAMKAIQNYCVAEGHTVVTESILNAALKTLLPAEALIRMGITSDASLIKDDSLDKIALSFKCQACGHVHHGSRPQSCPICGMGGHMFKLVESAIIEDGQSLETIGNRQLIWDKSAMVALESIHDLTIKAQIRNRLEKQALTQRINAITLAMVDVELNGVKTLSQSEIPLIWTEDAIKRLDRVPDGFMRQAAKNMVEEHARTNGILEISLEVAESGLGKAREKMHASMTAKPDTHEVKNELSEIQSENGTWECHLCGIFIDGIRPTRCANCSTNHFVKKNN